MVQPRRLFDCIENQLEKFGTQDMLAAKENVEWRKYSSTEIKTAVNNLSAVLMQLDVSSHDMSDEGADKIGIISNNRPEWLMTDMAVQQLGAMLVPVYPTTNPNEIQFIFNDAKVKYVFVSNSELYEKIAGIRTYLHTLKNIYSFDHLKNVDHWSAITALSTPDALEQVKKIKASIPESHLATIIYTSGTTGTPKGVMLTHKNIVSNLLSGKTSFPFPDAPDYKALSFLPLNHIFERNVSYIYLFSGICIYY